MAFFLVGFVFRQMIPIKEKEMALSFLVLVLFFLASERYPSKQRRWLAFFYFYQERDCRSDGWLDHLEIKSPPRAEGLADTLVEGNTDGEQAKTVRHSLQFLFDAHESTEISARLLPGLSGVLLGWRRRPVGAQYMLVLQTRQHTWERAGVA